MANAARFDLRPLVSPRSVALVGASDRDQSLGHTAAANLVTHSTYNGTVHLISSRHEAVLGVPTYSSLASLPEDEDVDVVLILVPAAEVPAVVEEAAGCRAKFCVVFSGGFGERSASGAALETELNRQSEKYSIRIVGPNSPGLINFVDHLGLTIQPGFRDDCHRGTVGLIAQSGGMGRCVLQSASKGFGFSYFFSPGNQLDLNVADYLEFLVEDAATHVIALVAEGFTDAERMVESFEYARDQGKPVVVLKLGRTDMGMRAVRSHTGAIAGSDRIFSAVCRQTEALRVNDLDELVALCRLLSVKRVRPPAQGVAIYGMSGGAGVLATDSVSAHGLELANLKAPTQAALREITGSLGSLENPVDIGAVALSRSDAFEAGLSAVCSDAEVGFVFVLLNAWYEAHTDRFVDSILNVGSSTDRIIVPIWMSDRVESAFARLGEAGFVPVRTVTLAARCASLVIEAYRQGEMLPRTTAGRLSIPSRVARLLAQSRQDELSEQESLVFLEAAGLRTLPGTVATSAERAAEIAEDLEYPVVMKAVVEGVVHKARQGFVRLDLRSKSEVELAWMELRSTADAASLGERWKGAFVTEMAPPGVDAFVGVVRDPDWGLFLALGLGGVLVEQMDEVKLVRLPASRDEINNAIADTRLANILTESSRGSRPDTAALVDGIEKVADLAISLPTIAEIDVNPLRVLSAGSGVLALDAFVRTNRDAPESATSGQDES